MRKLKITVVIFEKNREILHILTELGIFVGKFQNFSRLRSSRPVVNK